MSAGQPWALKVHRWGVVTRPTLAERTVTGYLPAFRTARPAWVAASGSQVINNSGVTPGSRRGLIKCPSSRAPLSQRPQWASLQYHSGEGAGGANWRRRVGPRSPCDPVRPSAEARFGPLRAASGGRGSGFDCGSYRGPRRGTIDTWARQKLSHRRRAVPSTRHAGSRHAPPASPASPWQPTTQGLPLHLVAAHAELGESENTEVAPHGHAGRRGTAQGQGARCPQAARVGRGRAYRPPPAPWCALGGQDSPRACGAMAWATPWPRPAARREGMPPVCRGTLTQRYAPPRLEITGKQDCHYSPSRGAGRHVRGAPRGPRPH